MPLLLLPSVPASLSYNPVYNLVNVMTIQEKTFVYCLYHCFGNPNTKYSYTLVVAPLVYFCIVYFMDRNDHFKIELGLNFEYHVTSIVITFIMISKPSPFGFGMFFNIYK
jgi:hypothetical protein